MQKAGIVDQGTVTHKRCTPTYDRYAVKTIIPAPGWRAVFWDEDGTHQLTDVHVLALGVRRRYDAHTGQAVRTAWLGPEDEAWELVALEYQVSDGWVICDEASNFCGLLPPGMPLQAFEQASLCRWEHAAAAGAVGA